MDYLPAVPLQLSADEPAMTVPGKTAAAYLDLFLHDGCPSTLSRWFLSSSLIFKFGSFGNNGEQGD